MAVGNGEMILLAAAHGIEAVGTAASCFFGMTWQTDQSVGSCRYTEAGLLLRRETVAEGTQLLARSSVTVTVYPDRRYRALILAVAAMHDDTLCIRLTEGVAAEVFDRYAGTNAPSYCLKLTSPVGETLYLAGSGDCRFDPETLTLRFRPGYSKLVLLLSEDSKSFTIARRLRRLFAPAVVADPTADLAYRREAKHRRTMLAHTLAPPNDPTHRLLRAGMAENGNLLSLGETVSLTDLCDALDRSAALLDREAADHLVSFLVCLFERYSRLPCRCRGDGHQPTFVENTVDPSGFSIIESLASYHKAFGLTPSVAVVSLAAYLLRTWGRYLKVGMLPFSGYEKGADAYRGDHRFDGSHENTRRYFTAAEEALFLVGDRSSFSARKRAVLALDFARKEFDRHFFSDGKRQDSCPDRRKAVRRPHTVTGICDACPCLTTLTRVGDRYLCPACREGKR